MSNSPSRSFALLLFLALALPTAVLAQAPAPGTADISGVVLDKSGKPVAGYPMKVTTSQWGEVVMHPTEDNGSFVVNGLPPGTYEFRVFEPGGAANNMIASKKVTVAAGQAEKIEIRLGTDRPSGTGAPKSAPGLAAAGAIGGTGVNWTAIQIAAVVLAAGFLVFYFVRAQRRPT